MRKARAFIMVMIVFCCSVLIASSGSDAALRGAYDGIVSAMASHMSEPRIALQGVSVVSGEGFLPRMLSFVRSDVSTYGNSLAFFDSGVSFNAADLTYTTHLQLLPTELLQNHLQSRGFLPGDVVLDGSVRLLEGEDITEDRFLSDDWSGIHVRFSLSLMVTGNLFSGGVIIEGDVTAEGSEGKTVTILAENLKVNNEIISAGPFVLSFGS